jgi:hypothetical protein
VIWAVIQWKNRKTGRKPLLGVSSRGPGQDLITQIDASDMLHMADFYGHFKAKGSFPGMDNPGEIGECRPRGERPAGPDARSGGSQPDREVRRAGTRRKINMLRQARVV